MKTHISDNMQLLMFFPSKSEIAHGGGIRPYCIAKELAKLNNELTEIWGWKTGRISIEQIQNYWTLLNYKIFYRNSVFFIEGTSSKMFTRLMGGSKWVLDFSDDPILQLIGLGIKVPENVIKSVNRRTKFARNKANHILFPSTYLLNHYPEVKSKSTVVMNATDPHHFKFTPLNDNESIFRIGLLTGLAPGRGVELLIEACKIVHNYMRNIELYIGYQSSRYSQGYRNKLVNENKLDWIKFITGVSYFNGANEFYNSCDITVIPHLKNFYMDAATPIKLFDSMACGRPIVATNCIEQAKIINESQAGLICEHSAEDMASKILELIHNRSLLLQMSSNARKAAVQDHSWAIRVKIINDIIEKL